MANSSHDMSGGTHGPQSRTSLSSRSTDPPSGSSWYAAGPEGPGTAPARSGVPGPAHHDGPAAHARHADARVSNLIFSIVGGVTAALVLVVGVILLSGALLLESVNETYRTSLGIVMVVYGTYRLIMLWVKFRHAKRYEQ
jgi:hypothetical protein